MQAHMPVLVEWGINMLDDMVVLMKGHNMHIGVYRYTDSVVAVLDATNMLIMLEALVSKCKFMLKTNLKLAWWRLLSLLGESILERSR